ncbi:hypothetical protein KCU91_g8645, partial [Aureobasidium melanogenum]
MRFWKDHPKEIEAGGDFPPPFRPAVAAAAWPPKAQDTTEPQTGSEESDEPRRRGWFKRTLGLGETTPPRPGTYQYDAYEETHRKWMAEFNKDPKPRETGRVFDNQGKEITGQVDKKGRPTVPKSALAPPKSDRITAPRRPRAEPITSHYTAAWGVGGPGGGSVPPRRRGPPGEGEHSREADSSGTNRALDDAPVFSRGHHQGQPGAREGSSKGSEWSTTSEPVIKPKTPRKRASSKPSSEMYWSDDSDTPVKPRALRRSGRVLSSDSFGARSPLSTSDPRSEAEEADSQESIYASSVYSNVDSEDQSQSAAPDAEEDEPEYPFPHPETWESQHDTRHINPLKLGKIPVRPLPPIAIHSTFQHSREAWGLPPLKLRCPLDSHRHPYHIYQWNTKKLNCYAEHESECQLCGASCCSVMAYTKAINEDPRPNPVVPLKYRKAFQRDIDQINAMKPQATDPFERMLKCDTCYRNVCPDCAGRCMQPACLRIICKSCGDPDPWRHCQCEMYEGKLRITYI